MPIELLYIIPIVALAFLVLLLVLNAQKRSQAGMNGPQGIPSPSDAGKPISDTKFLAAQKTTEERLNEYEQTISQINKSLSIRTKSLRRFRMKTAPTTMKSRGSRRSYANCTRNTTSSSARIIRCAQKSRVFRRRQSPDRVCRKWLILRPARFRLRRRCPPRTTAR